jgi:hypothetical protein
MWRNFYNELTIMNTARTKMTDATKTYHTINMQNALAYLDSLIAGQQMGSSIPIQTNELILLRSLVQSAL